MRNAPKRERWLHVAPPPRQSGASEPPPLDDDALIEAVVKGDARRAAQIHDRLISTVERTLYRIFGRYEPDHDDLVQTAFEQIVQTLMRKRFARACSLSSWASAVAANIGLKALRSRRRERRVFERRDDDDAIRTRAGDSDVEREVDSRRQLERARVHLAAMNLDRATAVLLHDVFGHELAEIALLTDVSPAAAQSRLVRGRRELCKKMGMDPEIEGTEGHLEE